MTLCKVSGHITEVILNRTVIVFLRIYISTEKNTAYVDKYIAFPSFTLTLA